VPAHVVDHPLAADRLAILRDRSTAPAAFRAALKDLSTMLVYEACRDLPTVESVVHTPLSPARARRPRSSPLLVPVLRAGLGMLEGALVLLPDSPVGFVGLKRDEETLLPDSYVTAIPGGMAGQRAIVLDPMLATGGSLLHTLRLLLDAGLTTISVCCVLAAPEGLDAVATAGFGRVPVVTAAVDCRLNEVGFIVPGLGDAGDRQFGIC
jgi:uracil phosphoribosyltransferase